MNLVVHETMMSDDFVLMVIDIITGIDRMSVLGLLCRRLHAPATPGWQSKKE